MPSIAKGPSRVKINRAIRKSAVGRYPASSGAMLTRIPDAVGGALTSAQLALLLDAVWDACQEAKAIACREAVAEGGVWDARRQEFRPLAA